MSDGKQIVITLNRHLVIGLLVGIAIGSLGTLGFSKLAGASFGSGGSRTIPIVANPTPGPDGTTPTPAQPVSITVTKDDHIRGNKDAKVVLVEYSDFECPFCGRHDPTMQAISKKYGDKVAWVYRHFPLSFHAHAMPAAIASECASEQGKFWEFSDKVFANQDKLTGGATYLEQVGKDLGLNMDKYKSCISSQKYLPRIQADQAQGSSYGVDGTPATFVNGQLVSGAVPEASLTAIIDQALAAK